jgi:hypothetical protein
MNVFDIEIPAAVADEIASWRRIIGGRKNGVDARNLLRNAASELWITLQIDRTVHPDAHTVVRQEVIDALQEMAEAADIGPDDAQTIFAEAFKPQEKPGSTQGNGHAHNTGIKFGTAAALRTKVFEPIKFITPPYIVEGCTILAGRPKLGKSWLMLEVGLAVALGDNCLGDTKCDEGDVLYLAMEDNERRLQSRMTKLLGYAREWPARFHYATEWPRANAGGLEQIRKWIASVEKPRLVVVDVLAMFRSPRDPKQSPYESDYQAVQALQRIASNSGVAIVIVHHLRKSVAEVDPFEKVSGTLGLSGGVDTVLILDRDGSGATLYGRGRDIEEIETAVEFSKETCRWCVLGAASEVRRSDERKAILDALADAEEPLSPREIADLIGHSYDAVRQMLIRMAKHGEITKTKRGHYACDTPAPCHSSHNVTTDENPF